MAPSVGPAPSVATATARQSDLATSRQSDEVLQVACAIAVPSARTAANGDLATSRQGEVAPSRHVALAPALVPVPVPVEEDLGDMSPDPHVAKSPSEAPAARLIKKDFYLTPEQDLQIDRVCMEAKARSGRNIARSDVVREALALYFAQRARR